MYHTERLNEEKVISQDHLVSMSVKRTPPACIEWGGAGESRPHPEHGLHLGLEDVTLEVVRQQAWGARGSQGLLRQLLVLCLQGARGRGGGRLQKRK